MGLLSLHAEFVTTTFRATGNVFRNEDLMSIHVTNTTPGAVDVATISTRLDEFRFSATGGADLAIFVGHGVFATRGFLFGLFLLVLS